jgi:HD-GYP domain-containing protein (c-di-GMP phosphodiesterase class II)
MSPKIPLDPGFEMAMRLRLASEAHDPTISSHLDRVSAYACELGAVLGLSSEALLEMRFAAPLHDLGKIGLPLTLLNKPGRLTPDEIELVKTHTEIGYRILAGSPWPVIQVAAQIARSHHESWDGTGSPQGLKGPAIPLVARIVAVADVYDALLSQRSYKQAWDEETVIEEMRRMRAVKFDPEILDVFLGKLPAPTAG